LIVFTGIIEEVGRLRELRAVEKGARITVSCGQVWTDLAVGDSVCVNGVCLTAVERGQGYFVADVSEESLRRSTLGGLARSLPGQAIEGITIVFSTVLKLVVFLVATFHFLLFGERWVGFSISLLPPRLQAELLPVLSRIHRTLGAYLRTQLIRIALVSTIVYIALTILQVRFALILAIMAGFLDIVPTIGPTVSSAVTALVALVQPNTPFGWSHLTLAIATIILYIGLNQLEENIILPPLIGFMVDLPPLVVLFAVLAGGQLAGILGLLLAVPVAASTKIVLRYLYAKLMDKPVQLDEMAIRRSRAPWRKRKEARR
jgi:predicted PurR-regulated permease PerM